MFAEGSLALRQKQIAKRCARVHNRYKALFWTQPFFCIQGYNSREQQYNNRGWGTAQGGMAVPPMPPWQGLGMGMTGLPMPGRGLSTYCTLLSVSLATQIKRLHTIVCLWPPMSHINYHYHQVEPVSRSGCHCGYSDSTCHVSSREIADCLLQRLYTYNVKTQVCMES